MVLSDDDDDDDGDHWFVNCCFEVCRRHLGPLGPCDQVQTRGWS